MEKAPQQFLTTRSHETSLTDTTSSHLSSFETHPNILGSSVSICPTTPSPTTTLGELTRTQEWPRTSETHVSPAALTLGHTLQAERNWTEPHRVRTNP